MIDFKNGAVFKLSPAKLSAYDKVVMPLLISGESVVHVYQTVRDGVIFTNLRLIIVNVQGMTGKKKDVVSLPYKKVNAFSVETSGVIDIDSELELWFSEVGSIRLEFTGGTDILSLSKTISEAALL